MNLLPGFLSNGHILRFLYKPSYDTEMPMICISDQITSTCSTTVFCVFLELKKTSNFNLRLVKLTMSFFPGLNEFYP